MKTTFKRISPDEFMILGARHKAVCKYDAKKWTVNAVFSPLDSDQEIAKRYFPAPDILMAVALLIEVMEIPDNN